MKAAADLADDVLPPADTIVLYHDPESHVTSVPTLRVLRTCPNQYSNGASATASSWTCEPPALRRRLQRLRPKSSAPSLDPCVEPVMIRDAFRCSVPGCTHTLYMEIHHLNEFSQGGTHDLDNLALLCSRRHAMWHDGLIRATGAPSTGLYWTDARHHPIGITERRLEAEASEALQKRPELWGGAMIAVPRCHVRLTAPPLVRHGRSAHGRRGLFGSAFDQVQGSTGVAAVPRPGTWHRVVVSQGRQTTVGTAVGAMRSATEAAVGRAAAWWAMGSTARIDQVGRRTAQWPGRTLPAGRTASARRRRNRDLETAARR